MKNKTPILSLKGLPIILLFISNAIAAQDVKPDSIESKMFNNAIYGSIGINMEILGEAWFTATAYYERMFRKNVQKSKISTFLKAGLGNTAYWEDASSYIMAQFGLLTGAKKHHLEASAGLVKSFDKDYDIFPLSATIGYRIQKPQGHFIFRTGVGWPETLYFGLGLSF